MNLYFRTFTTQNNSSEKQPNTEKDATTEKPVTQKEEAEHPAKDKSQNESQQDDGFDIRGTEEGKRLGKTLEQRFEKSLMNEWAHEHFDEIAEKQGLDAIVNAFRDMGAKMIYYTLKYIEFDVIGFAVGDEFAIMWFQEEFGMLSVSVYSTDVKVLDELRSILNKKSNSSLEEGQNSRTKYIMNKIVNKLED